MLNDIDTVRQMANDPEIHRLGIDFLVHTAKYKYSYNFSWLGRPVIQFPQDLIALQEIIWKVKPELVIETGIAHGGSLIFFASMLELIGGIGHVLGIDVEIRDHNRLEIENHPMSKRISMIEGSSIDPTVAQKVYALARRKQSVLVVLDSNHTHDHVSAELALYSKLVTEGSYLIVLDTAIEDMPDNSFPDRTWGKGNNPKTAVWQFLRSTDRFRVDKEIENKLVLTVAPDGYLKCIKS
jgi:cephalosporin hydroxylase